MIDDDLEDNFRSNRRLNRDSVPQKLDNSRQYDSGQDSGVDSIISNTFTQDQEATRSIIPDNEDTINIVFLGASGTGKSTTINAIPSFLQHEKFDDVTNRNLQVLQDLTFTYNDDDYIEHPIKINSTIDNRNRHLVETAIVEKGVTLYPTSYIFTRNGQKYRIIDTPGWCDQRGLDKDQKIFHTIMQYLKRFRYIHGIVLVNGQVPARATVAFKSTLNQFMTEFHESIKANLILWFTNGGSNNIAAILRQFSTAMGEDLIEKLKNTERVYKVENMWLRTAAILECNHKLPEHDTKTALETFLESKQTFFKLLEQCKTLEVNEVKNSVFINRVRNIIKASLRPRTLVQLEHTQKIKDRQKTIETVEEEINAHKIICEEVKLLEMDDDNYGYEHLIRVPGHDVCSDNLQIVDYNKDRKNIRNCSLFKNKLNCLKCHEAYDKHEYVCQRYPKDNLARKIAERERLGSSIETRKAHKGQLLTIIDNFKQEIKFLEEVDPIFAHYIVDGSLKTHNDSFEENIKMMKENAGADADKIILLNKMLADYRANKEAFKESLARSQTTKDQLTLVNIERNVKKLLGLCYLGTLVGYNLKTLEEEINKDGIQWVDVEIPMGNQV